MKKNNLFLLAIIALFGFISSSSMIQNDPWPVPDNYNKMKNPIVSDATVLAEGKALYNLHCKSCHGTKGLGDGPKAAQLETEAGDFSTDAFQSQTDGALFYKETKGRDDMPSFEKKLPDADDRWKLVHYMRTF